MPKEPYNLFSDAGSTLPGGTAYEDLMVVLKAAIMDAGGTLEVSAKHLMFVDRDEMIRVDDVYTDGAMRKVFSIETKQPNQNAEGCVTHAEVEMDDGIDRSSFAYRLGHFLGWCIAFLILFVLLFLVGQLIRVSV